MVGFKISVFTVDIFVRMFRQIRHDSEIIIDGKIIMSFKKNCHNRNNQ